MTDGRIPLIFAATMPRNAADRARTALVLARSTTDPSGFALVRHADSAAAARQGACACCRIPSDLVTVLRRLIIDRARGAAEFAGIVVDGDPPALPALAAEALADPFLAARCDITTPSG